MGDQKLVPLWDCVLIEKQDRINGLYVPDSESLVRMQRGTIVAVGHGAKRLKVGDDVFFSVHGRSGSVEPIKFGGREYIIAPEEAIVARVES